MGTAPTCGARDIAEAATSTAAVGPCFAAASLCFQGAPAAPCESALRAVDQLSARPLPREASLQSAISGAWQVDQYGTHETPGVEFGGSAERCKTSEGELGGRVENDECREGNGQLATPVLWS